MKKLLFLIIFSNSAYPMENTALPQDAVERYALVQGLAACAMEHLSGADRARTLVEYPKTLTHYVLTSEILSPTAADQKISNADYMGECEHARPALEEAARRDHTFLPAINSQEYRSMVTKALQKYRTKIRLGIRSLKILKEVTKYYIQAAQVHTALHT